MAIILSLDAGTTGIRTLAINEFAQVIDVSYRELTQYYPNPGWVEHDPNEILTLAIATLHEITDRALSRGEHIGGIGITNQRETVVAWDRATGLALAPAIVWQDKRTASRCKDLIDRGHGPSVRRTTGLILDPYFSATKMAWLLESGVLDSANEQSLGTIDSWLLWNLTGIFATDLSNASRTSLCDIDSGSWSQELCDLFGVSIEYLPEIKPSAGRFGVVNHPQLNDLADIPVSGILGDQQAALFGQACFIPGMIKATYGTGAFVVAHAGTARPEPADGLLTTVAWQVNNEITYAIEGSAFIAGAAIQWLRDDLGIIAEASELESLARSVASAEGLAFIPAFVGLGSPWWDESARGALLGITKGSTRANLANAVVDALTFEVRAIIDAMRSTLPEEVREIRVDGGAAAMDLLLERLSDQAQVRVLRPTSLETTAIGAGTIAGLTEGVFGSLEQLEDLWSEEAVFSPSLDHAQSDLAYHQWLRALEKSRNWLPSS